MDLGKIPQTFWKIQHSSFSICSFFFSCLTHAIVGARWYLKGFIQVDETREKIISIYLSILLKCQMMKTEYWVILVNGVVNFNTQLSITSLMFLIAMARRLQAYHYTPLHVTDIIYFFSQPFLRIFFFFCIAPHKDLSRD